MKVCHFTSVHRPEDIRVFQKECVSLAKAGHEVYLVERGESYDKDGVHIVGFGPLPKGKLRRITQSAKKAYNIAKDLDCDVYHIHDPELLPYAAKLKKAGKKVIFDSHEDVPGQIMDKEWIPGFLRGIISKSYRKYETSVVSRIDAVVAATPHIGSKFEGRARKVAVVNNYPMLDDIRFQETLFGDREPIVCYAGGISELRGEKIMIEAMKNVKGTLIIAGDHEVMTTEDGVQYIGRINHEEVNSLYGRSVVGLCILLPTKNYFYSQPIKMYEYMAAGIPFICSDFPSWKKVAEDSGAGFCVDPEDIPEISRIINYLLDNREEAYQMGLRGREYVVANCTWNNEEKSLTELYRSI